MKKGRRWLYGLMAAGLIGLGAGGGTFATFNATTTNPGNVFATGDIYLSNTSNSGTACVSNGSNNIDNTQKCDVSLDVPASGPSYYVTARIVVKNTGSIDASKLYLSSAGDCFSTQSVNDAFNTGSLCTDTVAYVQEVDSSGAAVYCWYGSASPNSTCTNWNSSWNTALSSELTGTAQTSVDVSTADLPSGAPALTDGDQILVSSPSGTSQVFTASSYSSGAITISSANVNANGFPVGSSVTDLSDEGSMLGTGQLGTLVDDANELTDTATTTSSSTTLLAAGSTTFSEADLGRVVTGTGIPANDYISSVTDSTHAVLDVAATSSNTGENVVEQGNDTPIELKAVSGGSEVSGAELPSGSTRYFTVGLWLPSTVGNTDMDLSTTFPLTWSIQQ